MIRAYQTEDAIHLINLLKLNTPDYFDPSEEEELIQYLKNEVEDYYVFTEGESILGAGGINYGFDEGKTARISWDLVHPQHHGKGIGTQLTQFRISRLKNQADIQQIVVRTSQLVHQFYAKNGFTLEAITPDYWAKGYDLYLMKLKITR